jgi:hypothetical protein
MDPYAIATMRRRRRPTFSLLVSYRRGRFALGVWFRGRAYALCFGRIA